MRNKLMAAVALAAVLAGGKPADAALMTYTVTGFLSAILIQGAGPPPFINAPFTWQVTGDTTSEFVDNTIDPVPDYFIPALSDTLTLGGVDLTPTIPTYFAWASVPAGPAASYGIVGFANRLTTQGIAWASADLFGYDGESAVTGVAVTLPHPGGLPTSGGVLVISGGSAMTFSASVDEPPGLAMLLAGLAGCTMLRMSRRNRPANCAAA